MTDHDHGHEHGDHEGHGHGHHVARSFEEGLADFRARKDAFFRSSPQSPIPRERRHEFGGLRYYAPSREHRLEGVALEPDPDPEQTTEIVTSDEKTRIAWRVGSLAIDVPGGHGRLAVFTFGHPPGHAHDADDVEELFVPFRDATSGQETYGAGRYLDVTAEEDGTYTVDFNLAYNPWCAYAERYSCPLPPRENWLPFRIEAGELVPAEAPETA